MSQNYLIIWFGTAHSSPIHHVCFTSTGVILRLMQCSVSEATLNNVGCLTHWGRDKMAAIFQTTFSNAFSWMKMFKFRLRFHWSLFSRCPISNIPALVQIMAWRRSAAKPLSEPMMVSLLTHIRVNRPQWVYNHTHLKKNILNISKQSKTKQCAYFMVYVLFVYFRVFVWFIRSLGVRNASINEELHCRQSRSKDENVLVWCGKLAYFPLDKMAADAFAWIKSFVYW